MPRPDPRPKASLEHQQPTTETCHRKRHLLNLALTRTGDGSLADGLSSFFTTLKNEAALAGGVGESPFQRGGSTEPTPAK